MDNESVEKLNASTYHMLGGNGPHSYAQNSDYQKQLVISAEKRIHELVDRHLDLDNPSFRPCTTFCIADLGCSIGPNTFFSIENIIRAIKNKYKSNPDKPQVPQFQVYFNDLIDNDFNTFFKNLPPTREYFAAATPGSFHGLLFPEATLHFAHCSTALHWLSRVPKEVMEKNSSAWNGGRVHYAGAGKEVKEAYSAQFREDMRNFLTARANEILAGGLMVLVVLGFPDGVSCSESTLGTGLNILGSCFQDMVNMGKIQEEKLDSFNLPFYYPSPSELKALIEENGSFIVDSIQALTAPMSDKKPDLQVIVSHWRAVIGGLVEEHFGEDIVDELFRLHKKKLGENPIIFDKKYRKDVNYFVFLKRGIHYCI